MASRRRECPCAAWVGYGLPNLAQKREKVGVWLTVGADRAGVAVQRRRREDGRRSFGDGSLKGAFGCLGSTARPAVDLGRCSGV